MIVRNPFSIKNAEQIDSTEEFVELYNADAVSFIKADDFSRVVVFQSSPGAGKSSLFRLLQPSTLHEIINNKEGSRVHIYSFLKDKQVINSKGDVRIAGVLVSCAQNYGILEVAFKDADAEMAFQSLFNARLIISAITTLLSVFGLTIYDANRLTFSDVDPSILYAVLDKGAEEGAGLDGRSLLWWAIKRERDILRQMEALEGYDKTYSAIDQLSAFKLFEPGNIRIDDINIETSLLFMIDDLHLLTDWQRKLILNTIMHRKLRVGIWISERIITYSIRENTTLGTDGQRGRDYHLYILEEQYGNGKRRDDRFIEVANKRANRYFDSGGFARAIEASPDERLFEEPYKHLLEWAHNNLANTAELEDMMSADLSTSQKAVYLRALRIAYDRKLKSKTVKDDSSTVDFTGLAVTDISRLQEPAMFYLCIENRIPYYCSSNRLAQLSSNNMNQFLTITGEVFDRYIAKTYIRSRSEVAVSCFDQERIVKRIADEAWDSIPYRYSNGSDIQSLVSFIVSVCVVERERGTSSYAGGSYTGIGIRLDELVSGVENSRYDRLLRAVSNSVAANYLCPRTVKAKNAKYQVLYLNRLFCARGNLPLAFGGWKRIELTSLIDCLREDDNV